MDEEKDKRAADTLGDALPREMKHVRDVLMPRYLAIGPAGAIVLAFMRAELDRATKALAEGDVLTMLRSYEALKAFTD
jgi:hypothetical protein